MPFPLLARPLLDPASAGLLAGLRRVPHLDTRVAAGVCCGEPDVRLVVRRADGNACVEVLCPGEGGAPLSSWCAVQVRGDVRAVWRGPARDSDVGTLVRFVDDLLALDSRALSRRYRLLG